MTPENIAEMEVGAIGDGSFHKGGCRGPEVHRAPAKGVIVTAVAAGLMSEAWVTYGLEADEIVALLHGESDEESKGLLAAYTAYAEHVQTASTFWGVMYKMLMGLVTLTGQERISIPRARTSEGRQIDDPRPATMLAGDPLALAPGAVSVCFLFASRLIAPILLGVPIVFVVILLAFSILLAFFPFLLFFLFFPFLLSPLLLLFFLGTHRLRMPQPRSTYAALRHSSRRSVTPVLWGTAAGTGMPSTQMRWQPPQASLPSRSSQIGTACDQTDIVVASSTRQAERKQMSDPSAGAVTLICARLISSSQVRHDRPKGSK